MGSLGFEKDFKSREEGKVQMRVRPVHMVPVLAGAAALTAGLAASATGGGAPRAVLAAVSPPAPVEVEVGVPLPLPPSFPAPPATPVPVPVVRPPVVAVHTAPVSVRPLVAVHAAPVVASVVRPAVVPAAKPAARVVPAAKVAVASKTVVAAGSYNGQPITAPNPAVWVYVNGGCMQTGQAEAAENHFHVVTATFCTDVTPAGVYFVAGPAGQCGETSPAVAAEDGLTVVARSQCAVAPPAP